MPSQQDCTGLVVEVRAVKVGLVNYMQRLRDREAPLFQASATQSEVETNRDNAPAGLLSQPEVSEDRNSIPISGLKPQCCSSPAVDTHTATTEQHLRGLPSAHVLTETTPLQVFQQATFKATDLGTCFAHDIRPSSQQTLQHGLHEIEHCLLLVQQLHKHHGLLHVVTERKSEDAAWLRLAQTHLKLTIKHRKMQPSGEDFTAEQLDKHVETQSRAMRLLHQQSAQAQQMSEVQRGSPPSLSTQASVQAPVQASMQASVQASMQASMQACVQASRIEEQQASDCKEDVRLALSRREGQRAALGRQLLEQRCIEQLLVDTERLESGIGKEECMRLAHASRVRLQKIAFDSDRALTCKGE